jgi:hypothetical protein
MSKIKKDFGKIFNIVPTTKKKQEIIINNNNNKEIMEEDDFALARETLLDGIQQLRDIMPQTREFAEDAETARAIEVFYNLVKTSADLSKDLMELHIKKERLDINKDNKTGVQQNITNNNLYVNTKELQEKLEQEKEEEK